jgi:dihydrofolate synthase/folylpolyglutamate synthase
MTYPQAVRYLESLLNYEKLPFWPYRQSLKLGHFQNFLAAIGRPQEGLRCIHVAGSKGKGSTCVFIAYILREAGYKTGLYTSPHLADFRERIRILSPPPANQQASDSSLKAPEFEGLIPRRDLTALVRRLKPLIDKYNLTSGRRRLSFFEVYTAVAFQYFKEKKVDFAVLETGLGGRLDATNACTALISLITPISYEHTDKLGRTLEKITAEKAGIIKNTGHRAQATGQIVISAPQKKEALAVIRKRCRKQAVRLYEVGKQIKFGSVSLQPGRSQSFTLVTPYRQYKNLRLSLIGSHQLSNASCAVAAVELLREYGFPVPARLIRQGLSKAVWPGRCEVISRRPWVVLDGAQNIASCQALRQAIKQNFPYRRLILVLGICRDKDIKGVCRQLRPLAETIILTKAATPRAAEPGSLAAFFPQRNVFLSANVKEARLKALTLAGKEDMILVTGSLFVAGEFRDAKP